MAAANMADLFGESSEDEEQQEQQPQEPAPEQAAAAAKDQAELEDDMPEDEQRGPLQAAAPSTRDLFGSDDEEDEDGAGGAAAVPTRSDSSGDAQPRGGRQTEPEEELLGPPLEVEAPLLPHPAPGTVALLRSSNIVGIEPSAFNPATFQREQEVFIDDSGRQRVRLSTGVMRWRMRTLPDGRQVPESNARIVRWEDGSMQLLLGSEVLDVAQQDIRSSNTFLFVQLPGCLQVRTHVGGVWGGPAAISGHCRLSIANTRRVGRDAKA